MNPFTEQPTEKVPSNVFDLTHDIKTSFNPGELVPTTVIETIPGDKFKIGVENMLRFAPLISPVMHMTDVTTHYFFVPNRLVWEEWPKFIIQHDDPIEAPYMNVSEIVEGSLMDYLGFPTGVYGSLLKVSVLPLAAYLRIWNEYYRSQDLQDEYYATVVPGDNTSLYYQWAYDRPPVRGWQHDYFTACLPWPQKGDTVQVPLTQNPSGAPVVLDNPLQNYGKVRRPDGTQVAGSNPLFSENGDFYIGNSNGRGVYDPNGTLRADIQEVAAPIETLRRAMVLQQWLEKNARGGSRYIESILAHFGVMASDARLQRPEYIGGSKQKMVISEVLSTAETADMPQGNMAGHGLSIGGGNTFATYCEEHGFIIGIISVRPKTAYQQGLHRQFSRFDALDYAWPSFAHLGEQAVLNREIYAVGDEPNLTFGYIPRYSEYRYIPSRVSGEMRSTLSQWQWGRIFASQPVLNGDFIACNPSNRIFAVTTNVDHIYAHIFNNITVLRKLPKFAVPSF